MSKFFACLQASLYSTGMDKVTAVKEAGRAAEAATAAMIDYLRTEPTPTSERAHQIIDEVLAAHGCESPEGHIVAGGEQAVEPHQKGSGVLQPGNAIVIDIYPRSTTTGYWADMTRTVCIGEPAPALQAMYDVVLDAQTLAISLIEPGRRASEVQVAVEKFFKNAGYQTTGKGSEFRYAEGFVHSIGHGVGNDIHMAPYFSHESGDVLEVGDIVTIEPGLYYTGIGGIRIEDMILVTNESRQNLTNFPKDFVIL